jgi:hypothetical protein
VTPCIPPRRAISPAHQAMLYHFEAFMLEGQTGDEDERDVRPLTRSAIEFMRSRPSDTSGWGPCLAILWFSAFDYESALWVRAVMRVLIALYRVMLWKRALWNDFWMCLWQLSREPYYVERLYDHLRNGNLIQKETGAWMVSSVCEQDEDFRKVWCCVVAEREEASR